MKLALTAGLIAAMASPLIADTATNDAPKDQKEKVSYAIGADIAGNLKSAELDLDTKFLMKGLGDGLADKVTMSDEERQATLQAFGAEQQAKMMSKAKEAADKNKAASDKFLEENKGKEGVKTTASGLQYKIEKAGDGPKPTAEDTVKVHYSGKLIDGTEFDSSYKRGEPAEFGVGDVIPGWTEALQLMPVGSKWQLFIPPTLAYGEQAPPVIGPNQALIFEVELIEIVKNSDDAKAAAPEAKKGE
ncbi:MAG TPA: FKBP-type peptidyl-prolyl cis-trans isomerase [Chthoniobacteraceae bacterium]|nr:FKBP-type peptidyl-prolyl cis-trans isomerase [Chthoniobacteraceae bacterium]